MKIVFLLFLYLILLFQMVPFDYGFLSDFDISCSLNKLFKYVTSNIIIEKDKIQMKVSMG